MIRMVFLLGALTLGLGACGGGGGIDPRLARLDLYEVQRLRVLGDADAGVPGMPLTPDAQMPVAGQAQFSGAAAIVIDTPGDVLALAGDVTLDVTFGDGVATGSVSAVFGQSAQGGIVDFTGALTLSGVADAVSFPLTYGGTLANGAEVFGFDGTLSAVLLGSPVSGFAAIDPDAQIDQAGATRAGTVVLFAEGVVTQPPVTVP